MVQIKEAVRRFKEHVIFPPTDPAIEPAKGTFKLGQEQQCQELIAKEGFSLADFNGFCQSMVLLLGGHRYQNGQLHDSIARLYDTQAGMQFNFTRGKGAQDPFEIQIYKTGVGLENRYMQRIQYVLEKEGKHISFTPELVTSGIVTVPSTVVVDSYIRGTSFPAFKKPQRIDQTERLTEQEVQQFCGNIFAVYQAKK